MPTRLSGFYAAFLLLWALGGGCGTKTGNPDNPNYSPTAETFLDPAGDYLGAAGTPGIVNCGYFTQLSDPIEIEAGRQCVRDSFAACRAARYLLDETNPDGTRFTSYVEVEVPTPPLCSLKVHAVSTDPGRFVGEKTATCAVLTEPIELACGVGD